MTKAYIFDIFLANLEDRLEPNEAYLVKSPLAAREGEQQLGP
jgi:hypothetical protein